MELLKALATAGFAGLGGYAVARMIPITGKRTVDLYALLAIAAAWAMVAALGLWMTRSSLPRELRRKKAPATPNLTAPEPMVERTTGGVEP